VKAVERPNGARLSAARSVWSARVFHRFFLLVPSRRYEQKRRNTRALQTLRAFDCGFAALRSTPLSAPEMRSNTCIVTGASGFVGRGLTQSLRAIGWRVIEWTRKAGGAQEASASLATPFQLGQNVDPGLLKGARALIHCAYDFGPRRWDEIVAANVVGSEKLFQAARQAGVERLIFISSLSAFAGCRSLYGKAKLEIEKLAHETGAWTIRPGLIYGPNPGGMFGRLVNQVSNSRWVPLLYGGRQTQYLLHQEDLANLVLGILDGRVRSTTDPVCAAHPQGLELKEILAQIAKAFGKRVSFVPIPWQLVWLALKTLELAGAHPSFRSDSLISIVYQDPQPSFAALKTLGIECRPLRATELGSVETME